MYIGDAVGVPARVRVFQCQQKKGDSASVCDGMEVPWDVSDSVCG